VFVSSHRSTPPYADPASANCRIYVVICREFVLAFARTGDSNDSRFIPAVAPLVTLHDFSDIAAIHACSTVNQDDTMSPLINRQHFRMLATLTWLITLSISVAQAAAPVACNADGRCPGLGQAFYLPSTNILDSKTNTNGHTVFKNALIGGCATLEDQSSSFRSFKTYETASKLTDALNTAVDAKAGIPTARVNIDATAGAETRVAGCQRLGGALVLSAAESPQTHDSQSRGA
jgi:hypothetical protein